MHDKASQHGHGAVFADDVRELLYYDTAMRPDHARLLARGPHRGDVVDAGRERHARVLGRVFYLLYATARAFSTAWHEVHKAEM